MSARAWRGSPPASRSAAAWPWWSVPGSVSVVAPKPTWSRASRPCGRSQPGLGALLLLWFGIDETPKIVLIALGAFFPVYLALVAGVRGVDRKWVELGRLYRLSRFALVRRILLPAALPNLFTGLRGALSLSWMFLVAAELIAATQGLGYLLSDGRETSRPDLVIAAILVLAALGKLSDGLLRSLERRALRWRDSFDGEGGA